MQRPTFTISALADNSAEISIIGTIGMDWWDDVDNTVKGIKDRLEDVKALTADKVKVKISSLGGDLFQALAIRDTLAAFGDKLEVELIGTNASAATVIAMAAKCRKMSKYGLFLVHKCSSYAVGNENDLNQVIEEQRVCNDTMMQIYRDATGISDDDLNELMEANNGKGRWLTFDEAKKYGFVTDSTEESPTLAMVASADISAFNLPSLPKGYEVNEEQRIESIAIRIFNSLFKKQKPKMTEINNLPLIASITGNLNADEQGMVSISSDMLQQIEARMAAMAEQASADSETITNLTNSSNEAARHAEELQARVDELTATLEKVPTVPTAVAGEDSSNTPKTYADAQKEIPFYAHLDD